MKKMVVVLSFVIIISVGCTNSQQHETQSETNEHFHHNSKPSFFQGDLREKTNSVDELPDFLEDKSENIVLIYSAAATHKDVLEHIPCYCGCGTSAGHRSSYDCFVHETEEDGSVVWDDHGTRCGVCLEIAATSVIEFQEGKTIHEIRKLIDEAYKEGYSSPTPTPQPPTN